jgi:hypothetical protein
VPVELDPGLYGERHFYRAEGRYSLVRRCNTWLPAAAGQAGDGGPTDGRLRQISGAQCLPGR